MKLYLPYPHLNAAARCFHPVDLGHMVELSLDALVFVLSGRNRSWLEMWIYHEFQLMEYARTLFEVWRGQAHREPWHVQHIRQRFEEVRQKHHYRLRQRATTPPWLNEERLYESHRIALIKHRPEHYGPFWPDALVEADSSTYWPKRRRVPLPPVTSFPVWEGALKKTPGSVHGILTNGTTT